MWKTIFMNQILFLKEYKKHKWKYFLVFTACLIIIVSILIYNSYLHAENNHTLRIIESNYSIIDYIVLIITMIFHLPCQMARKLLLLVKL